MRLANLVLVASVAIGSGGVTGCGGARRSIAVEPPAPAADVESPARRGAAADRQPEPPRDPGGAPAASPSGPALGPLGHLWTAETRDWNAGLLLTRDGDLLSFASGAIRVHARDDGRVLHVTSGCSPVSEDALAWVDAGRFLVVCNEELRAFSWPKLGSERVVALGQRVDHAAIGGGIVAVAEDGFSAADRKGKLRVLSAADGRELDAVVPPAEIQVVAVSPDGAKVLFATDDEVLVRDVRARTTRTLRQARLAKGFAFAPDGGTLFGRFDSFTTALVDPDTAQPRGATWRVGSWITAARWIDPSTVVATGSDGLGLFSTKGGAGAAPLESPVDDLGEGLAVSTDGATVCAGGRSGRIACFGRAKPGPSPVAGAFPAPGGGRPGGAPGAPPAAAAEPTLDGKLVSRQGKRLVVQIDPGAAVEVGSTGEVSKRFEQNLGFVISGWITIAEVKVVAADRGKLTLEIVAEKSAMTMNGRPVNHFAPGDVRLSLSPPP